MTIRKAISNSHTTVFLRWLWVFLALAGRDTFAESNAAVFKSFVNGHVPFKSAIVHRSLSKPDGTLISEDWWRMGYQSGAWYVLRITPDRQNSGKFVQFAGNIICGASSNKVWTMSDNNIHVAEKRYASNSLVDEFGLLNRSVLFSVISLGIPRLLNMMELEDASVEWDDTTFRSIVGSKLDKYGRAVANSKIEGRLVLDKNGLPVSAAFPDIEQFEGGIITYEYNGKDTEIPTAFNIRYKDCRFRYEFLALVLGATDLNDPYLPSMFSEMNSSRILTSWSNAVPQYVADEGLNPNINRRHLRRAAVVGFVLLGIPALIAIAALWPKLNKYRQKYKQ